MTALVLASAVQIQAPDSASAEGSGNCVVTVERMQNISEKNAAALQKSMALEYKSVLMPTCLESESPANFNKRASSEEAYWTPEGSKKLKRLMSEPTSPARPT